jgi:riboflavin kinase/FMN adenylyltransferase
LLRLADHGPVASECRGGFVSVGNFDGVHLGHSHLIRRLRERADAAGSPALALSFDPHPVAILRPSAPHVPLTRPDRTMRLMKAAGATHVGVFETGPWLLGLSARDFFDRIILGQLQARGMVEGPNFFFGHDRQGNVELLAQWCEEEGLVFEVAKPVELGGGIVSSSRIRRALAEGQVEEAADLLGRPHRVQGLVARGAGRGAGLGFPTANLSGIDVQIPANGVYAALAWQGPDKPPCPAAVHIGPNVTFGEQARTVEAHLIDFSGDLYNQTLELDFLKLVRRSQKFESVEALVGQMQDDVAQARLIASSQPIAVPPGS